MSIISITGDEILFDETFTKLSKPISEMLQENEEPFSVTIPFNTDIIKCCIEFCKLYDSNQFTIAQEPLTTIDILPKWCVKLMLNLSIKDILELMKVAYFLDIDILINVTCVKIAMLIKGQSPEKIREIFMYTNQSS
jgi:hypothetical protein